MLIFSHAVSRLRMMLFIIAASRVISIGSTHKQTRGKILFRCLPIQIFIFPIQLHVKKVFFIFEEVLGLCFPFRIFINRNSILYFKILSQNFRYRRLPPMILIPLWICFWEAWDAWRLKKHTFILMIMNNGYQTGDIYLDKCKIWTGLKWKIN